MACAEAEPRTRAGDSQNSSANLVAVPLTRISKDVSEPGRRSPPTSRGMACQNLDGLVLELDRDEFVLHVVEERSVRRIAVETGRGLVPLRPYRQRFCCAPRNRCSPHGRPEVHEWCLSFIAGVVMPKQVSGREGSEGNAASSYCM